MTKICIDSRDIEPGDIFMAAPGLTVDGRAYMQQAIDRGASQVYFEQLGAELSRQAYFNC